MVGRERRREDIGCSFVCLILIDTFYTPDDDDTVTPDYIDKLLQESRDHPHADVILFRMMDSRPFLNPPCAASWACLNEVISLSLSLLSLSLFSLSLSLSGEFLSLPPSRSLPLFLSLPLSPQIGISFAVRESVFRLKKIHFRGSVAEDFQFMRDAYLANLTILVSRHVTYGVRLLAADVMTSRDKVCEFLQFHNISIHLTLSLSLTHTGGRGVREF